MDDVPFNNELYQILSANFEVPTKEFHQLAQSAKYIEVPAQHQLMNFNQIPHEFYVIKQGLVRAVFLTYEGKEYTKEFFWENDIVFAMRGIITSKPLPYQVVSVEPCQLFQLPLAKYKDLVANYIDWKDYHLKQLETHLYFKEIKEELLLLHSNEQKVEKVYELFPDFVKRVPATLLASYLGLTPVSLSRIKKRLQM